MNVKLHTPTTMKAGSGLASTKQFFLSLIATTISIVLTFGTAGIIDYQKKLSAKKEMVMMVISDFDKTIDYLQSVDTALRDVRLLQQELTVNPELYDSLRYVFPSKLTFISQEFSETTEKIFTSSIETFSTIGNVNFVNEVSTFYMMRRKYKELILNSFKEDLQENPIGVSLESLMNVSFPMYVYENWLFLRDMKETRDMCMQMMHVSEKDMIKFNKQKTGREKDPYRDAIFQKNFEECNEYNSKIEEAREKLKN